MMSDEPPVTWNRLKRLFDGIDIAVMKMYGYYLDDYEKVAQNARTLLGRLVDGSMPPRPFKRWTPDMIAMFQEWVAGEFVEFDPEILQDQKPFIELSAFITGFDDLHKDPELAKEYHDRLLLHESIDNDILGDMIQHFKVGAESQFENTYLIGDENEKLRHGTRGDYQDVTKITILLWYTASFFEGGFPKGGTGEPDGDQYIAGLVWRAVEAHPMGYSAEGYVNKDGQYDHKKGSRPYWHFKPEPNGKYTGLGIGSVEP